MEMVMLLALLGFALPIGLVFVVLHLQGVSPGHVRQLRDRVDGLERRLADYARRLLASEGDLVRLRAAVQGEGAPSPSTTPTPPPPRPTEPPSTVAAPAGPRPPLPSVTPRASTTPTVATASHVTTPSAGASSAGHTPASASATTDRPRSQADEISDTLSRWADAITSWLFGGNAVVRVGVVILFFGVAFFLNYVAERGWFPIELRLASVAVGGLALLAVGWRLRTSRTEYALALQGGGLGIVYLTAFAAANLYEIIGAGSGLAVMVMLVVAGAVLAVRQDAPSLAVLATLGGFLGPVLVSRDGSHVALFSYYAVLDAGVVLVAWFRAWRVLNLLAFGFTFLVGTAWGVESYRPELFATTQPFLALFFLFFVAVSVLFAWRQPPRLTGYVDGTLVFGVPLAAFSLQHPLVSHFDYGPAWSALVVSLFYAVLTGALYQARPRALANLVDAFVALSVAFGTLMIPLALDGRWTGAVWALEGAALVWIGVRQSGTRAVLFGTLLQIGAGVAFLEETGGVSAGIPVLNILYVGGLMVSVSGFLTAWLVYVHREENGFYSMLSNGALVWGLLWWFGAGSDEVARHLRLGDADSVTLVFFMASFAMLAWLRHRLNWSHLALPPLMMLPVQLWFLVMWRLTATHPLAQWGIIAWPLSLAALFWVLWRVGDDWGSRVGIFHRGALWLSLLLVTWEASWQVGRLLTEDSWSFVTWALVPLAVVVALSKLGSQIDWPIRRFRDDYVGAGQVPILALVGFWLMVASVHPGDPEPLAYLPVLNPIELTQLCVLAVLFWRGAQSGLGMRIAEDTRVVWLAALGFVAMNGAVARATHYLADVPFRSEALWEAAVFQTALSIVWTSVAFVVMFSATRLAERTNWWAGVVLLGAVVVKLFAVDLADIGTIARIVSFVVVGLLILVIGYVSPLPPKKGV